MKITLAHCQLRVAWVPACAGMTTWVGKDVGLTGWGFAVPDKIKQPCAYMLASSVNGTLYIGVTSSLYDRVVIHKQDLLEGFTSRHQVHSLVWYEMFDTMEKAIAREKRLKKWNRLWKIRLIEEMNPQWDDLFDEIEGIVASGPGGQAGFQH